MSEELAEIEKAISQASNIIETLMRLQQKIDQQQQPLFQTNSEQLVAQHTGLSRLRDKFTDLNARIDSIVQSLDPGSERTEIKTYGSTIRRRQPLPQRKNSQNRRTRIFAPLWRTKP